MNISNQVLLIVGASSLLWMFYVVFVGVPHHVRSCIRYRLWQTRDRVANDLLTGELPSSELTTRFLSGMETVCEEATKFSFLKWLMFPSLSADKERELSDMMKTGRAKMTDQQRARFDDHQKEFHHLFIRLMLGASTSGWVVTGLVLVVLIILALWRSVRQRAIGFVSACDSVKEEIQELVAKKTRDWVSNDNNHRFPPLPLCH